MADYCAPLAECTGLDSRLLINRTVYGPALAIELAEIPFGPVHLNGASLHSSVTWSYEQTWSAKEACCGPVRSIFGLAPAETVTLEVRRREDVEVTDLVESAMESSEVRTQLQGERRPRPSDARTKEQVKEQMEKKVREMRAIAAKSTSSPFLEFVVAAIVADEVAEEVTGSEEEKKQKYADQVTEMHEHENGSGAGTINGDTLASIDSILERVETAESRNSFAETRTTEKTVTEQMLRRTFSNPYRDRALELRFIPVFRRFEVRTRLVGSEPGIYLKPGRVTFPVEGARAKLANFVRDYVLDPGIAEMGAADVGTEDERATVKRASAVVDHLNGGVHTRRLLQYLEDRGEQPTLLAPVARMLTDQRPATNVPRRGAPFADAFAWSRARVRADGVSVPMAALENSLSVFRPESRDRLNNSITKTVLDAAWLSRWVTTRSVHIFMGTRVEAVAGTCVLTDLPTP